MSAFDGGQDRHLPVYLMLDCSGSMSGDPIEAVRTGMKMIVDELKSDPMALQTVWLSVITFDSTAKQVVPLTEIESFIEPLIDAGGSTAMGDALTLLVNCIDKEVRKSSPNQKGDWKPLVFLLTDGEPTDNWHEPANKVKKLTANVIACGAGGNVNQNILKQITEIVMLLSTSQPNDIKAFFKWVTQSIKVTSQSISSQGNTPINFPPPPQCITLVP
jgi:uncharacterized protein YegL